VAAVGGGSAGGGGIGEAVNPSPAGGRGGCSGRIDAWQRRASAEVSERMEKWCVYGGGASKGHGGGGGDASTVQGGGSGSGAMWWGTEVSCLDPLVPLRNYARFL
jgi:hypothetical protein